MFAEGSLNTGEVEISYAEGPPAGPLLLLQADPALGGVLPEGDVSRATAIHPQTTHARFDGLGHMMHMHDPERVLQVATPFLEALVTRD